MKASELIKELQELVETDDDLDITVWADHGQSNAMASCVGIQHRDNYGEICAVEDLDEYDDGDFVKVIEISG